MKKRGGKKSEPRGGKPKHKLQGALWGKANPPGGRSGAKGRAKRLEGKPL